MKRVVVISQDVYFYFDDSGVFHRKEKSGRFVYAGYVFTSRAQVDDAKRKYIHANKKIKQALGVGGELKSYCLNVNHRRSLYNVLKSYNSLSAVVELDRVYDNIMNDKYARCRFKDYVLKRIIKKKLQNLIQQNELNASEDISIHIYIDEQLTASSGYYSLKDSIYEELQHGIINFDYGVQHPSVFSGKVSIEVRFCDSKNNYLIQASDIIANRVWSSYCTHNSNLRNIPKHTTLTFP